MEEINKDLKIERLRDKKLALFFTYGVSLELWEKRGLLNRELKLYQELGKYFNKIYFLTYGRNDYKFAEEFRKYNIEVLYKKSLLPNILYSIFYILYYRRKLKQCNYFKTNQMSGSWSAVLAKLFFKKKLIIRMGYPLSANAKKENWFKYVLTCLVEFVAWRSANQIVVATEYERGRLLRYQHKLKIISNYVDTNLFRPLPKIAPTNKTRTILFVGRLSSEKNLSNLVLALNGVPDVKLCLIGSGESQEELSRLAKENSVNIEFLGNISHEQLPKYINQADIFALVSLYEGNPKALLEAMACGVPVLATRVRGIDNIVQHEVNGYLSGTDVVSLRQSIITMLFRLELLNKLGVAAQQKIVNQHSLNKVLTLELTNYD